GVAGVLLVRPDVGGALALAALAAFTLVVVRGVLRGVTAGCGCFGSRRVEPVTPLDVARNGLLAALAAIATGTAHLVRPGAGSIAAVSAAVVGGSVALGVARTRLRGPGG